LTGPWRFAKAVAPHLIATGGDSIVVISSPAIYTSIRNSADHMAVKTGLIGLVRTLANQPGGYGIRVNSVHHTLVDTPDDSEQRHVQAFLPGYRRTDPCGFVEVARCTMSLPIP